MHTPGPWTISDDGTIEARGLGLVGHVKNAGDADRALIAAAPAMLVALQRLTHPMADDDDIEFALAIIARATGG